MKILDLFCGAGGAGMGYYRADFEVVGVDINPQPHYPFPFIQGDAINILTRMLVGEKFLASDGNWYGIDDFDAIHASPVCKKFSKLNAIHKREYPDFITPLRPILIATGKPYVIENVPEAPLINPLILCGTMFPELRVIRHRAFETNPVLYFPPAPCNHWGTCSGNAAWNAEGRITPSLRDFDFLTITGNDYIATDGRVAMGIDWMTKRELSQAIPPAYTEFIGEQLRKFVEARP